MDTVIGSAKKSDCMVSHSWSASFREVLFAIAQQASGMDNRTVLEKKIFANGIAHSDLEKSYWLCMFAANFHRGHSKGHRMTDVRTLQHVLVRMSSMLVVLDADLDILSRAWCAAEVFEADAAGLEFHFAGELQERFRRAEGLKCPGLQERSCGEARDKVSLVSHYNTHIGVEVFDDRTQDLLLAGIFCQIWRTALREGDLEATANLLSRRADVNCRISKQKDTALTWAVQYHSSLELLDLLLEARADPNIVAVGGWSALLFATQMGNDEMVSRVLAARGDPCATSQNGRTPLLEAAEREREEIVSLLLDAGADPEAADMFGAAPVHFANNLNPDVCQRLGWKPGMRKSKAIASTGDNLLRGR